MTVAIQRRGNVRPISALPAAAMVNADDLLELEQGVDGETFKVTASAFIHGSGIISTLTFGTHLQSGSATSYNGSVPVTIATDATASNTASTIVARDASGNFAAGDVTVAHLIVGTDPGGSDLLRVGGTATIVGPAAFGTSATSLATYGEAGDAWRADIRVKVFRVGSAARLVLGRLNTSYAAPTVVVDGNELGSLDFWGWTGAAMDSGAQILGAARETWTGSARGARLIFATTTIGATSILSRWYVEHSGHLLAATDNVYDVGATGATRPRTGYFGTSVVVATDPGGSDALRVGGNGTLSAGTNTNTTLSVGSGGSTPSAARSSRLTINTPDSVTFRGVPAVEFQRAGTRTWQLEGGVGNATGVAFAVTDFGFYSQSAGTYVVAVSAAGGLAISSTLFAYNTAGNGWLFNNTSSDAGATNAAYLRFQTATTDRYYLGMSSVTSNGAFALWNNIASTTGWSLSKTNVLSLVPSSGSVVVGSDPGGSKTLRVRGETWLAQGGSYSPASGEVLTIDDGSTSYAVTVFPATSAASGKAILAIQQRATGVIFEAYQGATLRFRIANDGTLATGPIVMAGNLTWNPDNTYDIGAAAATRPRTAYIGTSVIIATDPGGSAALRVGGEIAASGKATLTVAADAAALSTIASGGGDRFDVTVRAAGNGVQLKGLNSGGTDYSPMVYIATNHDFRYRTGVATSAVAWTVSTVGHFVTGTDNTFDIGQAGGLRPRTGYFATSLIAPFLDSGAAADLLLKRNATTILTLGAATVTLAVNTITNGNADLVIQRNAVTQLTLASLAATFAGTIATAAPGAGVAKPWKLGQANAVAPTAPDRTITVDVDGATLYIHAKTTND